MIDRDVIKPKEYKRFSHGHNYLWDQRLIVWKSAIHRRLFNSLEISESIRTHYSDRGREKLSTNWYLHRPRAALTGSRAIIQSKSGIYGIKIYIYIYTISVRYRRAKYIWHFSAFQNWNLTKAYQKIFEFLPLHIDIIILGILCIFIRALKVKLALVISDINIFPNFYLWNVKQFWITFIRVLDHNQQNVLEICQRDVNLSALVYVCIYINL